MPSIQSAESSQVTKTRSFASCRSGSSTANRRNSSKLTWRGAHQLCLMIRGMQNLATHRNAPETDLVTTLIQRQGQGTVPASR